MAAITLLVLAIENPSTWLRTGTETTEKNSHELTRMGTNNLIADCADCTEFISHKDAKAQNQRKKSKARNPKWSDRLTARACRGQSSRAYFTRLIVFSINRKDYEHLTKLEIRILQNIESELPGVDKSAKPATRMADKLRLRHDKKAIRLRPGSDSFI